MRKNANDHADDGFGAFQSWLKRTRYVDQGDRLREPRSKQFEYLLTDLMHYANREGWDFTQMAQWASTDFRLDLENCPHCELEFPLDDLKSAYIKAGECKEQHAARTEERE